MLLKIYTYSVTYSGNQTLVDTTPNEIYINPSIIRYAYPIKSYQNEKLELYGLILNGTNDKIYIDRPSFKLLEQLS